jgi:DNA-binding transcriptional LysR family regulator
MFESVVKKGLSYERLQSLVKVSEAGSLIRAANADPGRQSRLSHQLQELSEYFGMPLTERVGRATKLSASGEALAQLVRDHFLVLQAFRERETHAISTLRLAADDNLLQWLLIPALGTLKRPSRSPKYHLTTLRSDEVVEQLRERKIDFGIVRTSVAKSPLEHTAVCTERYAIFVPQRLVPTRGLLTVRDALLNCPHAIVGGENNLLVQLNEHATSLGGNFTPDMVCDSIGQCVAAVKTGRFASVLPVHAWPTTKEDYYIVVEDDSLDNLKREIGLVWHPRTIEVLGTAGVRIRHSLVEALKQSAEPE